jgi:hypothetical protein
MKTVIALLFLTSSAMGHDFYTLDCCSDKDCGPLPNAAVEATSLGWHVRSNNWTVPYADKKIRQSPDGRFHGCFRNGDPAADLLCLYVPGQGS